MTTRGHAARVRLATAVLAVLAMLAIAAGGCGGSTDAPAPTDAGADAGADGDAVVATGADSGSGTGRVWLALAADFATGTTCGDEPAVGSGAVGAVGCDLYRARLDATTWEPDLIERLTTDAVPEVFPSITADGARVYFHTMASPTSRTLGFVDVATKSRVIVAQNAQYAEVLPDGLRLLFTDVAAGNVLTLGSLDATGGTLTSRHAVVALSPAQDANASADGTHAVFHVPGTGASHGVYLLDLASVTPLAVTLASGIGHCAVSPSATRVVCDDAGGAGLNAWSISGSSVTGPTPVVADPRSLGASDPDYASCALTSADFPSFCDESHLALSVSCVTPTSGIRFSKVFLADLSASPANLRPLGASLATRFGGPGKTSWTASCRSAR